MAEKRALSEAEIIAWAIPRIAQGYYAFTDDSDGRELLVTERLPTVEEMEGALLYERAEPAKQALLDLRKDCNYETIRRAFKAVFGENPGDLFSKQFEGTSPIYELVIASLYGQERHLIANVQQLLVRERERLSSASGSARIESGALPQAMTIAVVVNYAEEVGRLFPRLIRRAEQLRMLQTEVNAPDNVQKYLEEASKCFVYGRFIACLIVCRSAIDFALRERLVAGGYKLQLESLRQSKADSLAAITSLCRSAFPPGYKVSLDAADEVRKTARDAVHKGEPDTETCKEMFVATRGILRDLYSIPNS